MIKIYNVISTFINSMVVIDFTNTTSKLPSQAILFYQTYIPTFIKYFIVALVVFYLTKLLLKVFKFGGKL